MTAPAGKARVYVVEDEAVIAIDLCERLQALGYEACGTAARGEAALKGIAELRPDLVLMDVRLAGPLDGVDVADRLPAIWDVPVVFLTAYSDPELMARVQRTQACAILSKPFDEETLGTALQMASRKARARRPP